MSKKIITDLDILTVAYWDSKKEANDFLERIKSGEFDMHVPYLIFDLLSKWRHNRLSEERLSCQARFNLPQFIKIFKKFYSHLFFNHICQFDAINLFNVFFALHFNYYNRT